MDNIQESLRNPDGRQRPRRQICLREVKKIREEAVVALKKAVSDMKKYYDRGRQDISQYQVGDKVYLEGLNVTTN